MKNEMERATALDESPDQVKKGTVRFLLLGTFGYEQDDKPQSVVEGQQAPVISAISDR